MAALSGSDLNNHGAKRRGNLPSDAEVQTVALGYYTEV